MIVSESRIRKLLTDAEAELKALFGERLSSVILYGSYARGDYRDESDVDVIALVDVDGDDLKKFDKQILRINVDLSIEYDADLSVVLVSKTDFTLNRGIIPLYRNIDQEGVQIYAA